MKKRFVILAVALIVFTAIDWLVINTGWYDDWHKHFGYPIYHYVFWVTPAVIVFWLFWNPKNNFGFNLFRCGAWLAVFAVMEDILYLIYFGITRGIYPYPQAVWQEAYYGWFGKVVGYQWWFEMPLGYFLAFIFLGVVYIVRILGSKQFALSQNLSKFKFNKIQPFRGLDSSA